MCRKESVMIYFNRFLSRTFIISFCYSLLILNFSLLISQSKVSSKIVKVKLSDLQVSSDNTSLQTPATETITITEIDSRNGKAAKANKLLARANELIDNVSGSADLSLSQGLNDLAQAQRLSEQAKSLVPFNASVGKIHRELITKKLDVQSKLLKSLTSSFPSSSTAQSSNATQSASSDDINIAPNMGMNFPEPTFSSF